MVSSRKTALEKVAPVGASQLSISPAAKKPGIFEIMSALFRLLNSRPPEVEIDSSRGLTLKRSRGVLRCWKCLLSLKTSLDVLSFKREKAMGPSLIF